MTRPVFGEEVIGMEDQLLGLLLILLCAAGFLVLPWVLPAFLGLVQPVTRTLENKLHTAATFARGHLTRADDAPTHVIMQARDIAARQRASSPPLRRIKEGLNRIRTSTGGSLRALGYKVCLGDTLRLVAHDVLGDSERWFELWQLNRGLVEDPRLLVPGTVLTLPRGCVPPRRTA